jgi:hypothetical protein
MSERRTDVLSTRTAGVAVPQPRAVSRSAASHVGETTGEFDVSGAGGSFPRGGTTSRASLSPRRAPASAGGFMPSDDELLERTLAFSGSYVSDDGNVTVRRVAAESFEYSGDRFLGNCTVCSRALLIPVTGEPLSDVRAAVLFVAAHDHGDED